MNREELDRKAHTEAIAEAERYDIVDAVSPEAYAAYVGHETSPILFHALEWIESEWRLELERVRKIDGRVVDVVGEAVRAFPAAETEDSIEGLCNADIFDIPEVVVSHLLAAFKASDHFESYLEWCTRKPFLSLWYRTGTHEAIGKEKR